MVDRHDLHATATAQGIAASIDRIAVDSDVVAVLPSLAARHLSPQTVAPGDDILRTVLVEHAEEGFLGLTVLSLCSGFARSAHRHLKIVVEQYTLPDSLPLRPFGLMPHKAALKLQECAHPAFAWLLLIEIVIDDTIGKRPAFTMISHVATVCASLITVVALAKHHDALAEDATGGIVPAHKGQKESIHIVKN